MTVTLRRLYIDRVLVICEKSSGVKTSLYAFSTPFAFFDACRTVSLFQPLADAGYLVLTGEKDEDTPRGQPRMNL